MKNMEKDNIKIKEKNASYMQAITLSEKISNGSIFAIVITAIVAIIDAFHILLHFEDLSYESDFVGMTVFTKMVVYVVLILLEVFMCKLSNVINKLVSTVFKYDDK